MSYIDAIEDRNNGVIHVVERDPNGERAFTTHPAKYVVCWPNEKGRYKSIYGYSLDRFQTNNLREFKQELQAIPSDHLHESDIKPIFRCLYDNYKNARVPELHVGIFDIETAFDPVRGFSSTEDSFSPINAVSIYLNWIDRNFTLVTKPDGMTTAAAKTITDEFEDTILCDNEKQLLEIFLDLIEDCDVISGWNSTGYDIPYIHNRILQVLGKQETRRLCLWGKYPKLREYEKYGKRHFTYELVGRVHLDYLELYQKNTYHEMHSYRLDFVGEYEVGEKKTVYDGTLDQLFNNDFKKFIEYNRQDVMLLVKIDRKKRFIELCNNMAHTNCVLFQTTMGSVALIDQAIVNSAHDMDLMVPSRQRPEIVETQDDDDDEDGHEAVAGAYVAHPKVGMHDWIGGVDINSLYPSAIRTLNMSLETIVGQIRSDYTETYLRDKLASDKTMSLAEAWNGLFGTLEYNFVMDRTDHLLTIDFEDGTSLTMTATELYQFVFESDRNLILSANGTLFDGNMQGLIPGVLNRWIMDRKGKQRIAENYTDLMRGFDITEELAQKIKSVDTADFEHELFDVNAFVKAIKDGDEIAIARTLKSAGNSIVLADGKITGSEHAYKESFIYWDMMQLIQKVLANATYGSLGNPGSRWFRQDLAQSTTLTGRCVVKHQCSKINEIITGDYNHIGKAVIYGDTDSTYFSAYEIMKDQEEFKDFDWTKENVINLYDDIAAIVNESFPEFMNKSFNCSLENGRIIKAGRELCALKGMFITKKRYAVLMFDKDGKRLDVDGKPGKIKAMGLDLKRTDTPKIVQDFLSDILIKVLTGSTEQEVIKMASDFRRIFRAWPGWEQGSPKRANKITKYTQSHNREATFETNTNKRSMLPGHVMASINWNKLRVLNNDRYSLPITDGQKIVVCKLKDNLGGFTTVAYPVDQLTLPQWFKDLPFDSEAMEHALIDKKLKNLLKVLDWDLNASKVNENFDNLFSF